jgi:hypothetical protein
MSEEIQEANVTLNREDAYIIIEGLRKTTLADGVMIKDLPPLLARVHQTMKKVSDAFVLKPVEEQEKADDNAGQDH